MSWLSNLLHPGRAYDQAKRTTQAGTDQAQGYLNPYNQNGIEAGNAMSEQMKRLLDPAGMQNEWAAGYEKSPYAQQLQKEAGNQGFDAASAMGLAGSSAALGNIQTGATNIMNQDRQQYMNDLMAKYQAGLGIGQNQYGIGAGAAGQMGQNAINNANNQAGLDFGKYNAGPNLMAAGGNRLMEMLAQYMGGGMGQGGYGRGAWAPKQLPWSNQGGY